jgi:subtilisin
MVRVIRSLGLLALGLCFGAAWAAAEAGASGGELVQRIVVFSQDIAPAQRLAIAKTSGGKVVRELKLINAVVMQLPASQVKAAEAQLKSRAEVVRVDADPKINWLDNAGSFGDVAFPDVKSIIKPFQAAPRPAALEGQDVPWGIKRVNAQAAWAATRGKGVKLVVIDTGIDYDHPELKGVIAGGWNAVGSGGDEGATGASGDWKDDNGHGTHVSGTIAASDNDTGVVGVAPQVSLYGVKVLDANGSGTFSDVIAGMEWAITNKMQVASMSLGANQGNESLEAAVAAMVKAGVTLIAAAGNSGQSVGFPAAYPGAIAVAASDSKDKIAYFSSRGPEVDILAPGVKVNSTFMGGGYSKLSGTSMACPHVSGLAALAISAKGLKTPKQVRAALTAAAVPLANVPTEQQGAGIVDAEKLVQ